MEVLAGILAIVAAGVVGYGVGLQAGHMWTKRPKTARDEQWVTASCALGWMFLVFGPFFK